jgi:cytochrome c oxidase assembly factor CtaG
LLAGSGEGSLHLLWQHWAFDPFLVLAAVTVGLYERGLHRMGQRSRAARRAHRRRLSFYFYGGLLMLLIAVESPIDFWAGSYLWVHMVEHVLMAFFAPALIVLGAPWLPIANAFPLSVRQRVGRNLAHGGWVAPLRGIGHLLRRPWVSVLLFNVAMLVWHLPGPFDLAERNLAVHVWVMHASFFATGMLFWLQLLPSHPVRQRMSPWGQAGAIVVTNVVMWVIAMSLGIFARGPWYSVYLHQAGVTLSPMADQQIGAGILWVCGDFWAIPAMFYVVHRLTSEYGGLEEAFEQLIHRGPLSRGRWTTHPVGSTSPRS